MFSAVEDGGMISYVACRPEQVQVVNRRKRVTIDKIYIIPGITAHL